MIVAELRFSCCDHAVVAERFSVQVDGLRITVPEAFKTDGSSIPRPLNAVIPRRLRYMVPSIVHDWLYTSQVVSREVADEVFRILLIRCGVSDLAAEVMFFAVRIGGWTRWSKCRRKQWKIAGVQDEIWPHLTEGDFTSAVPRD